MVPRKEGVIGKRSESLSYRSLTKMATDDSPKRREQNLRRRLHLTKCRTPERRWAARQQEVQAHFTSLLVAQDAWLRERLLGPISEQAPSGETERRVR